MYLYGYREQGGDDRVYTHVEEHCTCILFMWLYMFSQDAGPHQYVVSIPMYCEENRKCHSFTYTVSLNGANTSNVL